MVDQATAVASAVRLNQSARQVIATFDNYADAERTVDYLADHGFEVDHVWPSAAGSWSWSNRSPAG
jgi:hypothetical protein